ncbi:MAG: restriction endonuclease subunit S [Humibacter sp.]
METSGSKVVLNISGADTMRHVEAGDYISHLRSFQGGLEFAGIAGKVSAAYTVLMPKVKIDPTYFKYLFKSDVYVQALQTTTDQLRDGQSIRFAQFSSIPLPKPSLTEQQAIAEYLDWETAQLDALIAILGIAPDPKRLSARYLDSTLAALRPHLGWHTSTGVRASSGDRAVVSSSAKPPAARSASAEPTHYLHVEDVIARARRAAELARERRAALISAAVTGKIDVGVAA